MGREEYRYVCGQLYRTGAKEWDHLADWERNNRVVQTLALGVLFSAMSSLLGLLACLVLHFVFGLREGAFVTGVVIAALPFAWMQIEFWPGVLASIWRTRTGSRAGSGHS